MFNKDQSDFIMGNNDDFVKNLSFGTIQLSRDSLYWRQNTNKNPKLGVTGIEVDGRKLAMPKSVNDADNYGYVFDTAYQMISIPSSNTWEKNREDYYFFDRFMQNILPEKFYKNICMKDNQTYYNNANNCYVVPCDPTLFDSVFFQIDSSKLFEVRPEDYILKELTVALTDENGNATGEKYCKLAFT